MKKYIIEIKHPIYDKLYYRRIDTFTGDALFTSNILGAYRFNSKKVAMNIADCLEFACEVIQWVKPKKWYRKM